MVTQTTHGTLRPGLLVSVKTSLSGGVDYDKRIIERDHITKDGIRKARWETARTITDPEEFEEANRVRLKAASLIRRVCAHSAFGLLCLEERGGELDEAINEARRSCDEFNSKAKITRICCYVLTGRIAQDDVEAVRAINSEVRDLIEEMKEGVNNVDVKAIRDAASRLRSVGQMLQPVKQEEAAKAIEMARNAANQYVKAGWAAAQEIDRDALKVLTAARREFLDLDEAKTVAKPKGSSTRAVDLTPETAKPAKRPSRARQMEDAN